MNSQRRRGAETNSCRATTFGYAPLKTEGVRFASHDMLSRRLYDTDIGDAVVDCSNMVPWPKPANYNRSDWKLLLKYAAMPINQGKQVPSQGGLGGANHGAVPNGKHDMNNGGLISTDCTGCSWYYPNSTYEERRKIYQQHVDYQQGFLWTLAHDEAIPKPVQDQINSFGLCKE